MIYFSSKLKTETAYRKDADALFAAREIFKTPVIPIIIPRIAAEGGCLNCISWN